jgi:hypothetical protein
MDAPHGREQTFFPDPAIDRLMGVVFNLVAEVQDRGPVITGRSAQPRQTARRLTLLCMPEVQFLTLGTPLAY